MEFQTSMSSRDRKLMADIKGYLGLSSDSEAARVSVNVQYSHVMLDGGEVKRMPLEGERHIFTLRMSEDEKAKLVAVRQGYGLSSDAEAVRFSVERQWERTFGKEAPTQEKQG